MYPRIFLLVLLLWLSGCSSWTVMKQSAVPPLAEGAPIIVAPLEFEGMRVTKEQQELLEKGFGYGIRREAQEDFTFKAPEQQTPSDFVLRTKFVLAEGATESEVRSSDAEVYVVVSLMQNDELLDQVRKKTELGVSGSLTDGNQISPGLGWLSDQQQLARRGEELGDEVADYLQKRVTK